jgi:hypothetical protein
VVSTLALRSAAAEAETFPKKRYRGTHIGYEVQHRGKHAPQERMRQPHHHVSTVAAIPRQIFATVNMPK